MEPSATQTEGAHQSHGCVGAGRRLPTPKPRNTLGRATSFASSQPLPPPATFCPVLAWRRLARAKFCNSRGASMNAGRRNRVALSTVEVKGPRRSSILKKPEMTPDKENAANSRPVPASGRKSSLGGGDKKRRVSFSHTDQVHTITPTKAGPETKRSILRKAEPTPQYVSFVLSFLRFFFSWRAFQTVSGPDAVQLYQHTPQVRVDDCRRAHSDESSSFLKKLSSQVGRLARRVWRAPFRHRH